jgi:hypothetical protein
VVSIGLGGLPGKFSSDNVMDFADIKLRFTALAEMTPALSNEIARIAAKYPWLPESYLEFLEIVGHGEVKNGNTFYGGVLRPEEIYGEEADDLDGIWIFSDDSQGYCYGFDLSNDCAIVEINPLNHSRRKIAANFDDYILQELNSIEKS